MSLVDLKEQETLSKRLLVRVPEANLLLVRGSPSTTKYLHEQLASACSAVMKYISSGDKEVNGFLTGPSSLR